MRRSDARHGSGLVGCGDGGGACEQTANGSNELVRTGREVALSNIADLRVRTHMYTYAITDAPASHYSEMHPGGVAFRYFSDLIY